MMSQSSKAHSQMSYREISESFTEKVDEDLFQALMETLVERISALAQFKNIVSNSITLLCK